ncbi:helix-turn-helix domain-containing protein [Wenzhouxiangella sp. XN201]|nr:helix-turn-helix domain-containing protein [Wenzhouxiangella sp. XN201]
MFETGDAQSEAYIVRCGHLKSYRVHRDGEEQILGMLGPGDVLGFDALTGRPASYSVVALEIASLERIPLGRDGIGEGDSAGYMNVVEGMYRELQRFSRLLYMDRHPAERRLAEFLLDFSREEGERGRSRIDLMLPFNRRDLACFLGLAPETLSRTFSRFQEQGILSVDNREIHILEYEALLLTAGEQPDSVPS